MTFSIRNRWAQITSLILMVLSLSGLVGCTTSTTAQKGVDEKGDPRVEYKERNFSSKIAVLDIKDRYVGDLLQVNATLKNKWRMSLRFQYQFRFFDKDGFPIEQEGRPWNPVLIAGGDEINVTAIAPNPSAKTFTIVLQRGLIKGY